MDRLTTSAYASSRTCHYFYEIIVDFPFFNLIEQCTSISKTADNRSSHCNVINLKFRFLHTMICIKSFCSYRFKGIYRRIFTFQQEIRASKCRLHNTTSCSEDHTCPGSFLHRTITFAVFQSFRTDMCCTDHLH